MKAERSPAEQALETEHGRFSGKFWARVKKTDTCWLWQGSTNGFGYGYVSLRLNGKRYPQHAHRVAWRLSRGPIPPGMWVLHRCDNPPCVNPEHLFLGDRFDNARDCASKGRTCVIGKSRLTHCKHGHPFSDENTYRDKLGHRRCKPCRRRQGRENWMRRRLTA